MFVENILGSVSRDPPALELDFARHIVEDIVDRHAYSIQEAKMKAKHEARLDEASRRKELMQDQIAELRRQFLELVQRNQQLAGNAHLASEAFDIDPEFRERLEKEARDKEEQLRKELAYESERKLLAMQKLRQKYLDNLVVERIILRAFHVRLSSLWHPCGS